MDKMGYKMKRTGATLRLMIGLLGAFLLCGCQPSSRLPQADMLYEDSTLESLLPAVQHHVGGRSVMNRPIMYQTLGNGADCILIIASIHGSEPAGTPLVRSLSQYLQERSYLLKGKTVVIVPVANPDGLAHNNRHNARGVDLNRNFAANNRVNNSTHGMSGQSEPEAELINRLIKTHRPNRIVTLHQPLNCVDYDGPAYDLAKRMADVCDLPLKKLGSRPGSLGAYAGETLGIPIITFEMLKRDSALSEAQLWSRYGKAMMVAVNY